MSNIQPGAKNYWHLGGKIDPLGEIINAGILTSGSVFWVKDSSDLDYKSFKDQVGKEHCFTGIQAAIDKCVSDRNDYVMVCPKKDGAVWQLSAAIDLNEDNVHLISVGYGKTQYGYSNILEGWAASTVHDDEFINITGKNCEVAGFCFSGTGAGTAASSVTGTMDNAMLYLSSGAHNTWVHDCHFKLTGSNVGVWDDMTGMIASAGTIHGFRMDNVSVTSAAALTEGTIEFLVQGAECADWSIHDSKFTYWSSGAGHHGVAIGTGDIGLLLFKRCNFVNLNAATAVTTMCSGNITAEQGVALFDNCTSIGITCMGTDDLVYVAPTNSGSAAISDAGAANIGTATLPAAA